MFGDPISNSKKLPLTHLENIVKLQRGFDLPIQSREKGDIPIYGSNGILGYHCNSKAKCGIITGRSGTIGKVEYCQGEFWPLNTTLFSINTNGNNIVYLSYLLQYFDLKRFFNGTGVPTLNRNIIHKEMVFDISLELQNEFSLFVEQLDKSKVIVKKFDFYLKNLLQQIYYRGA